jgi:signal transduction histidine kinase
MSVKDPAINRGEQTDSHRTLGETLDLLLGAGHESRNGLDLGAVLRDVLSSTARSIGAETGFILILDEGGWPSHWFVMQEEQGEFVSPVHARTIAEHGIVNWVIQHRRGEVLDDIASDARGLDSPYLPINAEGGAALCLPLLTPGRVVGVLTLIHSKPGFFNPRHLSLLLGVADRAALSIENARLYDTVRRRAEEMTALCEVALNISADQPLVRLLDTVVAQAMDLLRCQGAGVFLWQEDHSVLELVAAYDPEIDMRGTRFAPGEGLVGQVFTTGDILVLDEYEDWLTPEPGPGESDVSPGLPAPTAIAAPLVWQGRQSGVLVGIDRTPSRRFDHYDRHLLTLLANQAAAVIASVQLHEETSRRLQELTFLNQTIQDITATLDLDEIFAVLTQRVMDLLGIEACSIALLDRATNDLVFKMASGGGSDLVIGQRVQWGQGIVGAAAQSGAPINVSDVAQDDRFYQEIDKKQSAFVTESILAVPMISRGKVVGVVEGLNKPGGFDSEDERLLSALASLVAPAVENADLVSAQRELEALRENLIHMIVHDLRSPVGTISNSLQLLGRLVKEMESDQAVQLVDIAGRATRRLLNLVDSLLDMSRLEGGHELTDLRPVSIKLLIKSAIDQVTLYAQRKRMHLSVQCPDELPFVLADGGMIERVLLNLLNNALKYTPADGEVIVQCGAKDDALYVRVRDNGPGISPEFRSRIFDKFARAQDREKTGGFGLGLAFCRLAVEAHGGLIWVESTPGEGSTFAFTLPLDRASDAANESPARSDA